MKTDHFSLSIPALSNTSLTLAQLRLAKQEPIEIENKIDFLVKGSDEKGRQVSFI